MVGLCCSQKTGSVFFYLWLKFGLLMLEFGWVFLAYSGISVWPFLLRFPPSGNWIWSFLWFPHHKSKGRLQAQRPELQHKKSRDPQRSGKPLVEKPLSLPSFRKIEHCANWVHCKRRGSESFGGLKRPFSGPKRTNGGSGVLRPQNHLKCL